MVEAVVGQTLRVHGGDIGGEGTRGHGLGIGQRDDEGAQRDTLQRNAGIFHVDEGDRQHERNGNGNHHAGPEAKADEADDKNDGDGLEQRRGEARDRLIDHGRLIASGSPLELTRGGSVSTIRLVVTRPFPPGAPESLTAALGPGTSVTLLDSLSLLVTGPADASTLARVSRWCEEHDVLPESLNLGTRSLEDVFLELTGRELTA